MTKNSGPKPKIALEVVEGDAKRLKSNNPRLVLVNGNRVYGGSDQAPLSVVNVGRKCGANALAIDGFGGNVLFTLVIRQNLTLYTTGAGPVNVRKGEQTTQAPEDGHVAIDLGDIIEFAGLQLRLVRFDTHKYHAPEPEITPAESLTSLPTDEIDLDEGVGGKPGDTKGLDEIIGEGDESQIFIDTGEDENSDD